MFHAAAVPGTFPCRAFSSRTARSPLSGPRAPSPLVTGAPGATTVPWIPRVSPTPALVRSALMGADPNTVAWFPPGLVRPFPHDLAVTLPRRLRARSPDSPGEPPAPSTSERCSVRECVHTRRRFPVAARSLLSSGSPLQSLRPVLCSGPSCPARSPRACARASRRPGSLTHDVGGEPVPSVLSEVHEGGVPASAIVDVRRRRSCRLSAAVPDPHDLRPGLAPFAWSPGCSSTGPAPVVTVSPCG